LASDAPAGPGAVGIPGAIEISPQSETLSQGILDDSDAGSALFGGDFILVDASENLPDPQDLNLIVDLGSLALQVRPISSINQGTYWTITYPDGYTPALNFHVGIGFESAFNQPIAISDIRVVPPAWNNTAGGDWNTSANWTTFDSGLSPNTQGLEADFLGGITSNQTVSTSTTVNIGTILLSNTAASYTLAATASGNITMNMPGVEPAVINDQAGTHFISAPLILASSTNITVANSGDALHLSGQITGARGLTINGSGTVSLESANNYGGATTVTSGTLLVNTSGALPSTTNLTIGSSTTTALVQLGTNTGIQTISGLTINSGSALDVTNNHIIIDYAAGTQTDADAQIRQYLINGYAGGTWTGGGINSSAAALPANNASYTLGYADGADTIVYGVSTGEIEVKYTIQGDANLDGVVNGEDFTILASNLGKQVNAWDRGDFNYDGVVGGDDFTALVSHLGMQANGADLSLPASDLAAIDAFAAANGLMANVPEPTSAALLLAGGICLAARRRFAKNRQEN
jgi:autotransporter-associated beta strand protein